MQVKLDVDNEYEKFVINDDELNDYRHVNPKNIEITWYDDDIQNLEILLK